MLRFATERQLITIGEALNRILVIDKEINITASRRIVQFRSKITHKYDGVESETMWGIIIKHMPILKIEVNELIEKIENK